ncbi:MAG: PAS domain S-box protein, partial [Acidobacteriota bacterium]
LIAPLFHSMKRSADALRESEEKYRVLFEKSRDAIYIVDNDGRLVDFNQSMVDLYGYTREELMWMNVGELYVDCSERASFIDDLHRDGYVKNYEVTLRRKDSTPLYCLLTATLRRSRAGEVLGYEGTVRDMTHRKQMEEQLRENNRILNAILTASPIGICLVRNRTFEWVNDAMYAMLGYEPGHLQGKNTRILYSDSFEYDNVGRTLYNLSYGRGFGRAVTRWTKGDGSTFHCLLQSSCLDFSDPGRGNIVAVMDITELKRTEDALRESEERYRKFFEEDLTGDYISTPDGRLLACNPAMARIFGFSSVEEALKHNLNELYPNPAAREEFLRLLHIRKKLEYHQNELRRIDGKPLYCIENAIGKFDGDGKLLEIQGYLFDNTNMKYLEEQFRQAQKMEAVGRLAGGIAHDFNNLLTAINGYSDLLLLTLSHGDPLRRNADEIKKAAERAASLTSQLLAFSRKQVLQPEVLDLNHIISDMERMLHRLIGEDIDLVVSLTPGIGHVKIDPGQIEQVIMNLAINARDAMPAGGRLTIETADVDLDEAYCMQHVSVQPGSYVMLAVSDSGIGMDEETFIRAFEPFFTTKEKDKGTGLGLSTVYGIVKQSDGHIWAYSEPDRGTTFKIYLPRIEGGSSRVCPLKCAPSSLLGSETILFVEDDEMVRSIVSESLRANGYTVIEAPHGTEALSLHESCSSPIHLLLTDVIMPGMNGRELAERLVACHAGMKVLFISGYTDKGIVHNGVLDPGTAFLQKPFRMDALARKVREVLDCR